MVIDEELKAFKLLISVLKTTSLSIEDQKGIAFVTATHNKEKTVENCLEMKKYIEGQKENLTYDGIYEKLFEICKIK